MDVHANNLKRSIVGIGDVCVQAGNAEMVAYAIGSCIALCLYDSYTGIGAMAHILLPSVGVSGHENKEIDIGTKYADHAIFAALKKMRELGAKKSSMRAGIIGGAEMFPHGSIRTLNIGEMNISSVTEELKKTGIPLAYSVTGGKKSRTVTFKIPGKKLDEQIYIKSPRII